MTQSPVVSSKPKNAYILLGWPEKSMEQRLEETLQHIKTQLTDIVTEQPIFFITGTPQEIQFYNQQLEKVEDKWMIYSSNKAYDTLTNFTLDIKPLLHEYLKKAEENVNFVIISGISHAQRIKKIIKLLQKDETFKKCTFQVIGNNKIFEPKSEIIAKFLYTFGKIGIYTSQALAYALKFSNNLNTKIKGTMK